MAQGAQTVEQLVVIGASADGIEALATLVASMPAPFPAPIVVIAPHPEAQPPSHPARILARHSRLPVRAIEDRARLDPGVVFVAPAARYVDIQDGELRLSDEGAGQPASPVEHLFRGAARAYGERLIAVVLAGAGADATAGAQEVKAVGGTVVSQSMDARSRSTSTNAGARAPAFVDVDAPLEQIGLLLHDLVTGAALPLPDGDRSLRQFLEQVQEQSGIDVTVHGMPAMRRRVQRRMAAVRIQHLAEYQRYTQRHPEEYRRLLTSFLSTPTQFFRDPALYSALRHQIVPALVAEARARGNELRCWCAGCATGQEAYSLAMVVAETLGDELEHFNVRIFATDLDPDAITVARHGIYPATAIEQVPAELRARYFTPRDGSYQIAKRVRALIVFGQHDLGQSAPFSRIDLCICRDMLSVFTAGLRTRTLHVFAFSLRDGGILVLGRQEAIGSAAAFFHPLQEQPDVFRRLGERLATPPSRFSSAMPALPVRSAGNTVPAGAGAGLPTARPPVRATRPDLARCLLALPVGVVLVNREYDIQLLNGAAGRLFGLRKPAHGEDLLHQVRGLPEVELRALIDAAFQPEAPHSGATGVAGDPVERVMPIETPTGERRYLQIACSPYAAPDNEVGREERAGDLVLVLVSDVTRAETERRAAAEATARIQHEQVGTQAHVERALAEARERLQGLSAANRDLQQVNQDLIAATIEWRSAHEAATVTSEEAQTAMEEVETLNEELQAGNEEWETLNEELHATIEELKVTNEELQVRSAELQEQTAAHEEQRRRSEIERARLGAILNSLGDAVLVVDPAGAIALTNPAHERMFGAAGPVALEDATGQPLPAPSTPQARAARGESFGMQFTLRDAAGGRRWFEAQGEPVAPNGAMRWGVVVIRDITERSLRRLQDEFVANVSHGLQTPITVIRASLGLLATGAAPRLAAEERDLLGAARQHAEQLRAQIEDLLTANQVRIGAVRLEREPLDLRDLAVAVVESLRVLFEQKQQQCTIDLPEPLPVLADARRIDQVLLNLLTNANRHTPTGTTIRISGAREADAVRLVFRDDGPGVPEESLEAIFEPFQRLSGRAQGSGLGLHIARTLVAMHGGRLWAERPADGGIAFHMVLSALVEGDGEGGGGG